MPKHALWTDIDGEPWLDNPRRRRRRTTTDTTHRRKRRKTATKGGSMAKRVRRRHRRRTTTMPVAVHGRRGRRRHYRRNPALFGGRKAITSTIMDGVKGGAGVVVGKIVARSVPTLIGQSRSGLFGIGLQALVGVILAPIVSKMGGGEFGKAFLWGAFASPLESFAVKLNLPVIGPALSSYADELSAVPYVPGALAAGPSVMPGFSISEEEEALIQ